MNPQFSVIIPAYNAEKTIARCLDSLLNQMKGYSAEIIVVDDGSADQTATIVQDYQSHYPEVHFNHQRNSGVSSARNTGLELAKGDYVSFVDADDYVLDDYFQILQSAGDADLAVFPFIIVESNMDKVPCEAWLQNVYGDTKKKINGILFSRTSAPWNKRFKRGIIAEHYVRFEPELYLGEDFLFTLSYMMHCESVYCGDRFLYCVDESNVNSLTRKAKKDFYAQSLLMYQKAFQTIESSAWSKEDKAALMQTTDYIFCRTAFACAEDVLAADGERPYRMIRQLASAFCTAKPEQVIPRNATHKIMQFVVRNRMTPIFWLVARAHMLMKTQ